MLRKNKMDELHQKIIDQQKEIEDLKAHRNFIRIMDRGVNQAMTFTRYIPLQILMQTNSGEGLSGDTVKGQIYSQFYFEYFIRQFIMEPIKNKIEKDTLIPFKNLIMFHMNYDNITQFEQP